MPDPPVPARVRPGVVTVAAGCQLGAALVGLVSAGVGFAAYGPTERVITTHAILDFFITPVTLVGVGGLAVLSAIATTLLAVGTLRGNRRARTATCAVSGLSALAGAGGPIGLVLVVGPDHGGSPPYPPWYFPTSLALAGLGLALTVLIIVLLLLPPAAAFFRGHRPARA